MKLFKTPKGDVVELIYPAGDALDVTINGEPAAELVADTTDAALEKHVPAVSKDGDTLRVQVGEVKHPMLDAHYITNVWVEYPDGTVDRKTLKPGEEPVAEFDVAGKNGTVGVYEYCNLHGLWKKEFEL